MNTNYKKHDPSDQTLEEHLNGISITSEKVEQVTSPSIYEFILPGTFFTTYFGVEKKFDLASSYLLEAAICMAPFEMYDRYNSVLLSTSLYVAARISTAAIIFFLPDDLSLNKLIKKDNNYDL